MTLVQEIESGAVAVASPAERFHSASRHSCVFCEPDRSLIVLESPKFMIMFDPFPVVSGHLLLAAKDHFGCLGEVPPEDLDEHEELRREAEALLRRVYGPVVRYEHGRAGHCLPAAPDVRSCHHHHEHLVPALFDLHGTLSGFHRGFRFEDDKEVVRLFDRYGHYLLFEDAAGVKVFYPVRKVPPHALRTFAANAIGQPQRSDWELYSSCELLELGRLAIADAS